MTTQHPEHEKLALIADKSQCIGEFVAWLDEQGILLASWGERDELHPHREAVTKLLARFFEIDLDRLEAEKQRLLTEQRAMHYAKGSR